MTIFVEKGLPDPVIGRRESDDHPLGGYVKISKGRGMWGGFDRYEWKWHTPATWRKFLKLTVPTWKEFMPDGWPT